MMKILLYALYDMAYGLIHLFYEIPRGIDFFRMEEPKRADSAYYQTETYRRVKRTLFGYVDEHTRMLDVGCGKGHMLYCAIKMGILHVDGVEYNPELAAIALKNLKKLRMGDRARVMIADATTFSDLDDYNLIYLFNPFFGRTMRNFLKNVEMSLVRRPREMTVVYVYPQDHALWDNSRFFKRIAQKGRMDSAFSTPIYYYRHTPRGSILSADS